MAAAFAGPRLGENWQSLRFGGLPDLLAHERNIMPGDRDQLNNRHRSEEADRDDKSRADWLSRNRSMGVRR